MRQLIFKLGRTRTVIAITTVSVLLSIGITLTVVFFLRQNNINVSTAASIFIAISVPLIVAPSVSWSLISLLLRIHQLEQDMRRLATYDSLTGLLSRRAFMERANYFVSIAKREEQEFSIMVVDMDYFKKINDQYGHATGDRVLASFGKTVSNILRESDLACRLGGEEFALFLPNTSPEQAWKFSERLHAAIRGSVIECDGLSIRYTASMGLTSFPEIVTKNIEELLNMADKALYSAKKNGRNQTAIFNTNSRETTSALLTF